MDEFAQPARPSDRKTHCVICRKKIDVGDPIKWERNPYSHEGFLPAHEKCSDDLTVEIEMEQAMRRGEI
jgi:hypothetical protein